MGNNPHGGNRNNFGLPNVGSGDSIQASDLNRISDAIARRTPGISSGVESSVTGGGTVFNASSVVHQYHPWVVTKKGDLLHIEFGQFFWDSSLAGGINQVAFNSDQYLQGGRNAWLFNSALGGAAPFNPTDLKTASFHMGGAEIWVEDKYANVMANKHMFVGMDGYFTKAKCGLYYVEVAAWGGRQMTTPYTSGTDLQIAAYNQSIAVWNAYSTMMKGKLVPQIRFAPNPDGPDKDTSLGDQWSKKGLIYPICTIDSYGGVWQGIKSDIYHTAATICPFTVSILKDGTSFKASVYPGMVNQVVPKIGGKYLDETPAPLLSFSTGQRIYIKATHEDSKFFPKTVEIVALSGSTPPEDTLQYGYAQIASTSGTSNAPVVTQLTCGNKLVNRFTMGATGAFWNWSA